MLAVSPENAFSISAADLSSDTRLRISSLSEEQWFAAKRQLLIGKFKNDASRLRAASPTSGSAKTSLVLVMATMKIFVQLIKIEWAPKVLFPLKPGALPG